MTLPITHHRRLALFGLSAALLLSSSCGEMMGPDEPEYETDDIYQLQRQELTPLCTVNVQGQGQVSVEDRYIAGVIACEAAGDAGPEALKALAIAARTFTKYKVDIERVSALKNSQGDHVFTCPYRPNGPEQKHITAANATRGLVMTKGGNIFAGFYVAGAFGDPPTCRGEGRDPTSTEGRVTYNEGRRGSSIRKTNLGSSASPHNQGCLSQNGTVCLERAGRDALSMLKFYYGDDVELTQLGGACGGDSSQLGAADNGGNAVSPSAPTTGGGSTVGGTPSSTNPNSCVSTSAEPNIVPRSAWGALPPKCNRSQHTPNKITIHHTVQGPSANGPAAVRQVQEYHQRNNSWCDIGYHFMIDRDGSIYEANPEDRVGAHVGGANTGNLGISLVGNFEDEQPSSAQINATAQLVRHLSGKYDIALDSSHIKGHRDQGSTACPGANLYAKLSQIISTSAARGGQVCNTSGGGGGDGSNSNATTPQESNTPADPGQTVNAGPDLQQEETLPTEAPTHLRIANNADGAVLVDGILFKLKVRSEILSATGVSNSQGVTNPEGAIGRPNASECDSYAANVAVIAPGGYIDLELPVSLLENQIEYIQFFDKAADSLSGDCDTPTSAMADVSFGDGTTFGGIQRGITSGKQFIADTLGGISFASPIGEKAPRATELAVDADERVTSVDYYEGTVKIASSTDADNQFKVGHTFDATGTAHVDRVGSQGWQARGLGSGQNRDLR